MTVTKEQLVYEYDSKVDKTFINFLKSNLVCDPQEINKLLTGIEKGTMGNFEASDIADELWDNLEQECRQLMGIKEREKGILSNSYPKDLDLSNYRNVLNMEICLLLGYASGFPLIPEDIPFIREFLNCPKGKEKEYLDKWDEYWGSVDWNKRWEIALM